MPTDSSTDPEDHPYSPGDPGLCQDRVSNICGYALRKGFGCGDSSGEISTHIVVSTKLTKTLTN